MTFLRRLTVAAAAAALAVSVAAPANAQDDDAKFADQVAAMQIPVGDVDLPALGHGICDMLSTGLAGSVNPVPVVRGVVNRLAGSGISRGEAAGLMRAAVAVYCPQHARFMGR
ncbi:DUF732 domain-containing protein [Mycolicibacterium flavescens]|uniref:DUF732 domain-containing protein n=1 Tax=Mycolicibacterium flavescens TaxID=1776 RepID=A0A1E3RLF0_MYCFV|nr:DUF732 domain-containing protein [Mycolicibacterium flavescens]MCV7281922.1 DUF732 domain-containing protein [Mycolicibacterium flavescens]ODQ90706.1 hypothetical protein BHQ18_08170 [Mycolicibacterium flavescens]